MAETDVFSALNVGSGLNTSELIKNLVDAERAPKEEKINEKIETAEVSISAIAELKNSISESNSVIKSLDGTEVFTGSSTSTAVSLNVTDPAKVSEMMSTVSVTQLAKSQTLVYDGFTSATESIGSGSLVFQRGTWNNGVFTNDATYNSKTVTIGDTSYTLTDIKDAINSGNIGATASVVKKSATDFALVIRASSGSSNSFQVSVTEGNNAGLKKLEHKSLTADTSNISSGSGSTITTSNAHGYKIGDTVKYLAEGTALSGLTSLSSYKIASVPSTTSFTLTNTDGTSITYGGGHGNSQDKFLRTNTETVSGTDASFTVDGVNITRSTNTIDDVIDGASLTLSTTTTSDAFVSISTSKDKVLSALENLIEEVNKITSQIQELTARGLNGEEKGALAGDSTMRTISQRLKKITTEPMDGFSDKSIYLANLGVSTTQDGMLVLNSRTFDDAFANSPQDLTSLFTDRLHSTSSLVIPKLSGAQTKTYEPGRYYFDIGSQGKLEGGSISADITSSSLTPSSGSEDLQLTVNGTQSGVIKLTGGPYTTTASLASALETHINADNTLAGASISVNVEYLNDKYIISSKKYGSESSVVINSIDSGLDNYLGLNSGTSTLGLGDTVGASLTSSALEQTPQGFRTTSGKAMGLSLNVTAPGASAYISIGNSFLSGLSDYLAQILTPKGVLTTKTDSLNQDLSGYNEDLVDLDEEIEKTRQRYKEQYGAMEATVNSFKSTGEYLTNYMDAQNSD
tara:strand:+ start:205 stop:2436 length:2232 start_codon:yes stop_codon:yes gene_type:complete